MICVGSIVNIIDNSGGRVGCCIKVLGNKDVGKVGDKIIVSIKKVKKDSKVKKKMIYYGLVLRTALPYFRLDGSRFKFDRNSIILINKKFIPVGSRIKGPLLQEFREEKNVRSMSISSEIL